MHPARRRLVFLSAAIAALAAVLAIVLPATIASAAAVPAAGNRVGASHPVMILTVGVFRPVSAGEGRCGAVRQGRFAAGACVAREDALAGSGPVRGVIEVSSRVKSTAAFRNLNPATSRDFVFDPENERLLVGSAMKGGGHWGLATTTGMNEDTVVGGELTRGTDGEYLTNELSGHYGENWNDVVRQQFTEFMSSFDFDVVHTPWGG